MAFTWFARWNKERRDVTLPEILQAAQIPYNYIFFNTQFQAMGNPPPPPPKKNQVWKLTLYNFVVYVEW